MIPDDVIYLPVSTGSACAGVRRLREEGKPGREWIRRYRRRKGGTGWSAGPCASGRVVTWVGRIRRTEVRGDMAVERTLVLVKPDGVERGLVGEIISRFERLGMRIVALRLLRVDEEMASRHYAEHVGKPFYPELVAFITSGEVVAMILEGEGAIGLVRKVMGPTNPVEAPPGTIRGDYGVEITRNLVHGSDGPESAAREIALFFPELAGGS